MISRLQESKVLQLLRSGVFAQALLSLGSLGASVLLIRHASDADFGRFVLVQAALLLLVSLQSAILGGPVAVLGPARSAAARGVMMATVHRANRRWLNRGLALGVLGLCAAPLLGLSLEWLMVGLPALLVAYLNLRRELLRGFVQACLRQQELPFSDFLYVSVSLLITAAAAYFSPHPVSFALLGLAVAAAAASRPLVTSLRKNPSLAHRADPRVWAEILPLGRWAIVGALIFWLFAQGYNYLLALKLSVTAVAAVAATRLLLMPVNLLATSLNGLLIPMASTWNQQGGLAAMIRRLLPLAAATMALSLVYCALLWGLRETVADQLLQKNIQQYDTLLALWMLCVLLALLRNLLQTPLLVQRRFRFMAALSAVGAVISTLIMLPAMARFGAAGALMGLVSGEIFYLLAVLTAIARQFIGPHQPQDAAEKPDSRPCLESP